MSHKTTRSASTDTQAPSPVSGNPSPHHSLASPHHPDPQTDRRLREAARERVRQLTPYDRLILLTLRFIIDGHDTAFIMQHLSRSKKSVSHYRVTLYDVLVVNSLAEMRALIEVADLSWTRHFISSKTGISDPYHLTPETLSRPRKIAK